MQPTPRRVAAVLALALLVLAGCAKGDASGSSTASDQAAGAGTATCSYPTGGSPAKAVDPPSGTNVPNTGTSTATITLDGKPVQVTLDRKGAPCAVHSFESLARQGWFDGTRCHRLTDQGIFVLQCGDPSGTGQGGPGYSFADELTTAKALPSAGTDTQGNPLVSYPKGTVAMANAGADTNGSQFFIVYEDSSLQPAYTVLGQVDAAGLNQVQSIAAQGVAADGQTPNALARISQVTLG